MTRVQRRVIQAGVLAVVGLACVADLLSVNILPDRLEWRLSLEPYGPWSFVVDIVPGSSFVLAGLVACRSGHGTGSAGLLMVSGPARCRQRLRRPPPRDSRGSTAGKR